MIKSGLIRQRNNYKNKYCHVWLNKWKKFIILRKWAWKVDVEKLLEILDKDVIFLC